MSKRRRRGTNGGPDLFGLRCQQCDAYLTTTTNGYWSCPHGHGRLRVDVEAQPAADRAGPELFDRPRVEAPADVEAPPAVGLHGPGLFGPQGLFRPRLAPGT